MANRIQLRRGSAQEWSNVNPTLAIGELGIEIDTGRIKIGDGITAWNSLRYERPLESIINSPNTLVQRDSDGNFQAGLITASLIGNSSTATRLANTRQIALTGDVTASSTFDGSSNLNLVSSLQIVSTLPHYDSTNTSSGTYTKVTVDAKGRITNASNPSSLEAYNLAGTVEGQSAQGFDRDLQGIADLTTTGIITRVSDGNIATRSITGTSGRISVTNGSGVSGNPVLDLINTTVTPTTYNTPTVASASQTIQATNFTVDQFGRLTYAADFPIATAVEGTTAGAWAASTSYSRYDKVTNSGRLYQALNAGTSGATAPIHTTGDASDGTVSWRHLGLVTTRQKGLASFDQEDFDVDANGHVVIASAGVDNTQLQNNQIRFADGNSYTAYELDNEHTASTGYRGITTINDLSVNNTSGSPLLKCLAADNNVDINTTTATIFSDITLDKTSTSIQTINRAGSLTILMDANTASNRFLRFTAQNAGTGNASMELLADESVSITSTNTTISLAAAQQISLISSGADVRVEDFYFANNVLSSTNSTIVLDPAGIGDNTGVVQIKGDLQVDGTTTTVNSTTITIDDVILTLGGDQTPTTDDNKDRGIEFKYYDTQARLGFYGWDDSYTTLAGTTGGYRFLYNATNTSEVFSGTDAGVIAGNLALSSNVGSTSTTSGTLVVTGGAGISQNLWVGGTANVAGNTTLQGTLGVTNLATFNNGVTIAGNTVAATEYFRITDGAATPITKFLVDTSSGNTTISGTLGVTGATTLTGNLTTQSASTVNIQNTTNTNVSGAIAGTAYASLGTYGALKVDGGASVANGLVIGGSLKVYGQIDVDGATSYSGDTVFKGSIAVDNDGLSPYKFAVTSSTGRLDTIGQIVTTNATDASSTSTGALIVTGGAGIGAQLRVAGVTTLSNATDATALGTGALVVSAGGASINNQLRVGGAATITGATQINNTLGTTGITTFTNATDATALGTGALVVSAGGASINNQLRVGGNTTLSGTLAVTGNTTLTGTLAVNSPTISTTSTGTATVFNTNATTVNIGGAATTVSIGASSGTCTINNANTIISGNLTVNGTTTTVNATTVTLDDPIITLGGDTAPASDDNKDRGVEFRYFDVSAKLGFFGWDDSQSGYSFFENATNASEVFSGTYARLFAGRLNLSTGTTSTSTTSGTLIVTGGTGISENLWVGGTTNIAGQLTGTGGAVIDNIRIGITTDNTIDTSTGNLTIDSAGGTTTINDIVSISGVTTVTNATAQTVTGPTFTSDGAFRVTGGVGITGNLAVGGNLRVFGSSVISGGVTYSGTQSYSGVINQTNTNDATSSTDTNASIYTAGGVAITKKLYVGNNTILSGALNVTGATTLSSSLDVTALITANAGITLSGSATVGSGEDFTITNGTTAKFTVTSIDGSTITEGNLTVKGNTTLGDAVGDTITVNGTATFNNADITGTIRDARKWTTSRTLSFTGDATGSMSVDGSANASTALTLAASGVTAGTYTSVTVNSKGLVTSATSPTTIAGYGITDAQPLDSDLTAVAGLTTTGLIARTATGTAATRSVTVSGTGLSITNGDGVAGNIAITSNATNNNAANTIVARDASGNFTAGTITANLTGNTTGTHTGSVIGNADSATQVSTVYTGVTPSNTTHYVTIVTTNNTSASNSTVYTDAGLTFNPSTNVLTSTGGFVGDVTGNATTATTLQTARTIGGVSFNGSANISLPGVDIAGTQNTSGNAATATKLATARTINGVSFDGTSNISITPVYSNTNYSGTGTQTTFAAASNRSVNDMLVIVAGLIKTPAVEYTYNNTTSTTATGTSGTTTITVTSATGIVPGMAVTGTGIGTNAVVSSVVGTTVTLSVANSGAVSGTISFGAVVTLTTAPAAGTNNVSIRYLPLLN